MRIKTFALCTASFAALTAAAPAAAQQQTPPDPNVQAQSNPADPAAGAPQTDDASAVADDGDTIVVTGLRRSLQSAQNIKRNSEQIVDAIVAEDIGKLPDTTVSDTAARIPGIQVERSGGEASRVLVRGLDRFFYATTYNGREIFTAETRSVALQDFPSGAIGAVEAFKSSTADLIEPGLAGLVNVRSRRPFDFRGFEVAGSAWLLSPYRSRKESVNGNLLVTNRWKLGEGELGALIGGSYTQLKFKDATRRHGFFIAPFVNGTFSPDFPQIDYNIGNRWRPSLNGTLQYRNGDLQIYAEGLWQGYRERQSDTRWEQPLWNCGEATYSNIVLAPGTQNVVSGTVNQPGCDGNAFPFGFAGAGTRKTNTYQFAIGGSYDAGPLKVTADFARTRSRFEDKTESVDWQLANNNFTVDWFTGLPGSNRGPTFTIRGIDLTDINNYRYRGFFEEYQFARGDDWQGRVDFEYETGLEFLPRVQFGLRAVDRDASRRAGAVYWDLFGSGIPLTTTGLNWQLFGGGFRGDDDAPTPQSWFVPTFDSVQSNLVAFRQFNIARRGAGGIDGATAENGPNLNPARAFDINERSLAAYLQLGYAFDLGGIPVDGRIGMRVVRAKQELDGFNQSVASPVSFTNRFTDWLPNVNLRAQLTPELVLRLAATQTRTRPEFSDLNPSTTFGAPVPNAPGAFRDISRGNPGLQSLESNNYDASLEYYFSRQGFVALNAFYRDISGFLLREASTTGQLDSNNVPFRLTQPVNSGSGVIKGVEAQVRTFFDFGFVPGFLRNFGVEANVTRMSAETDQTTLTGVRRLRIPDTSKWVANLTGMYEGHGFTSRLSYNWRSGYAEGPYENRQDFSGIYSIQGKARSYGRLDWSNSYAFNDNLTLFADWTNILKQPFRSEVVRDYFDNGRYTDRRQFPMVVRFDETIISGGVRFKF